VTVAGDFPISEDNPTRIARDSGAILRNLGARGEENVALAKLPLVLLH
jgi:hypothetical protein